MRSKKKTTNALRIAPVAPLISAEQPRGWYNFSSNGEGCTTAIPWHGLEKCTVAARQMGGEGRDMGWWPPYPPSSGAWLTWGKHPRTLTLISSPHGMCWEAGIWKRHMEKITALLLSKLLPRTIRKVCKKQDAGNSGHAGRQGMLFEGIVLLFPSDSQFGAFPGVKRQVTGKDSKLSWRRRKMVAGLALNRIAEWLECSPRKQERGVTCPPQPEAVKNLISYLSPRKVL